MKVKLFLIIFIGLNLNGCTTIIDKPDINFSVKNYETDLPIAGANLYVLKVGEDELIAVSDSNGMFQQTGTTKTVFHGYPFPIPTPGGVSHETYKLIHTNYDTYRFLCIWPTLYKQHVCGIRNIERLTHNKKQLYLQQKDEYLGISVFGK